MATGLPAGLTHSRITDADHRATVAEDGRTSCNAFKCSAMRAIRRSCVMQSVQPLPVGEYIAARYTDRPRSSVRTAWESLVARSRRRITVSYC